MPRVTLDISLLCYSVSLDLPCNSVVRHQLRRFHGGQCGEIMSETTFGVVLGVQMSAEFGACRSVVFMSFLEIYVVLVSFSKISWCVLENRPFLIEKKCKFQKNLPAPGSLLYFHSKGGFFGTFTYITYLQRKWGRLP